MNTNDLLPKIKDLLRTVVLLQDRGKMDCDVLSRAGYELSFIDRLAIAAHTERMRMIQEGLDVHKPIEGQGFTIGLQPWPYKPDPPCEHEWYPSTPGQESCPKCGQSRNCA